MRLLAADHGEIFVVGDDDQSVYSFRGADITFIRRFEHDFPTSRQVRLEDNFRSTGHILAAANAVIAEDKKRLGKTLRTTKAVGEPIEVVGFHNAEGEAAGIAAEIRRRGSAGVSWDQIAVLYRSNHMSRGIEEALMRSRVPYVIVGDVGFYQRAEIKDALALLRLAARPDDFNRTRHSDASATHRRAGSARRRLRKSIWKPRSAGYPCCRQSRPPNYRRKPDWPS